MQNVPRCWDGSRRTAAAVANREVAADPDTRPLNPSSSSTDPEPKRTTTTTEEDAENSTERMDVDNFQRTPATSHPLEPVGDENVPKKARVARNFPHIRSEGKLKLGVNEEAWPNADLAHSLKLRRCIGPAPRRQKPRLSTTEKSTT